MQSSTVGVNPFALICTSDIDSPFELREPLARIANATTFAVVEAANKQHDCYYKRVKRVMWERVGINRERESLERAIREFSGSMIH